MSSSNLIRWSGLAAVLGGVLGVVSEFLRQTIDFSDPQTAVNTAAYAVDSLLGLLLTALIQLGLVGLYARQAEASGVLGLISFLLAFLGTGLALGLAFIEAFVTPVVVAQAPELMESGVVTGTGTLLAFSLFILGWILFGVATLMARVYPRPVAILLIVGTLLLLTTLPLIGIIYAVAVGWLGFVLFTGRDEEAPQPARVS